MKPIVKLMKAFGFVGKVSGLGGVLKFLKGIMKIFGKLFLPISLLMGAWAAISGGLDEAAEESGGFPQKILSFISGALKGLLDFFIFDLAALIQDGIKWAIGWFMGLFGFSEEEIEKATDWDLVGTIKDALFKAIDFVRDIFRFEDTSLKGIFTSLIDMVLLPLNLVGNFLKNLFEWGDPEEPFSIGKMVTDVIDNIFSWFGKIFDIDVGAIFKDMLGGLGKAGAWLAGKLGLGPDTKESLEEELAIAKKGVNIKGRQKVDKAKVAEIEAKLEKFATGGTILPGGMAIVGEGSMGRIGIKCKLSCKSNSRKRNC